MNSPNSANQDATQASLALASTHYENFPVASILLPMRLRKPIGLIYAFARQADDFADEGDLTPEQRLELLNGFKLELDKIANNQASESALFTAIKAMVTEYDLPLAPFYDLLDAFSQDVVKSRYQNFGEVIDYCRRSANPVGRLLLHLYGYATPRNIGLGDAICSALQIINFLQDVAIDYKKDRIYFPLDEMEKYKVTEKQIANGETHGTWPMFMEFEIDRARRLLQSGAPLGLVLPGRIGLEMRMIIAGGERILHKLHKSRGDIYSQRPVLNTRDWLYMGYRAITKR
ncbi:squalene synthase HpnC [Methyloradius palustris]|uniref:Squalene synthase HpnC n=1 Tax=Methyloradius palustris TaxID=2778876 RepID=A0A8D5JYS7_9PROT|nr:squalene synthase HpnC [Methyloradius palustris]BCM24987.1 squalene synthase HpnC [Methyloradius palustris]